MEIKLTPAELKELTRSQVIQVGWLLELPSRGSRVFVPLGTDPKRVSIDAGETSGDPMPCYVPSDRV